MPTVDALRAQFDAITATEVTEMLTRKEPEGLTLEFKTMRTDGNPSDDDIDNLKAAISGFANSAGGIILWGCSTKNEGKKETHRLCSLSPIVDAPRLLKRLHELSGSATDPSVDGILHEAIPVNGGHIVKTLVPASDATPHRTRGKAGQYYKRNADSFLSMEHFEIADLFGRRARPKLEAYLECGFLHRFYAAVGLRNAGRGVAKFPFLSVSVGPPPFRIDEHGVDGNRRFGLKRLPKKPFLEGDDRFAGGADDVILPGMDLLVTAIGPAVPVVFNPMTSPVLVVYARFGAEGIETASATLALDIAAAAAKHGNAIRG